MCCSGLTVCFHGSSKGVLSGHQCNNSQRVQTQRREQKHQFVGTRHSFTSSYLFLLGDLLLWFGDNLLLLGQDHLNVAWGAHVGVDAAVSAVRASPHLGGLVDLDVFDDQRIHVQTLASKSSRKVGENLSRSNVSSRPELSEATTACFQISVA